MIDVEHWAEIRRMHIVDGGGCDTESEGESPPYTYDSADRLIEGEGIYDKLEYDNLGRVTGLPPPSRVAPS